MLLCGPADNYCSRQLPGIEPPESLRPLHCSNHAALAHFPLQQAAKKRLRCYLFSLTSSPHRAARLFTLPHFLAFFFSSTTRALFSFSLLPVFLFLLRRREITEKPPQQTPPTHRTAATLCAASSTGFRFGDLDSLPRLRNSPPRSLVCPPCLPLRSSIARSGPSTKVAASRYAHLACWNFFLRQNCIKANPWFFCLFHL